MKENEKHYQIVDIGSNTVKYNIMDSNGRVVAHRSARLGFIGYIRDGVPSEEGMERLIALLGEYIKDGEDYGCLESFFFATASFRSCRDPYYPIERIKNALGIDVRLFSGEDEAMASFSGMLSGEKKAESGILADMGGASTELVYFRNREKYYSVSNPFGALFLKNRFVSGEYPVEEEQNAIYGFVGKSIEKLPLHSGDNSVFYLIGGSAKAFGTMLSYEGIGNEYRNRADFEFLRSKYSHMDAEKSDILKTVIPQRFDIFMPSLIAFCAIFDKYGIEKIRICRSGIHDGIFADFFSGGT